MFARSALSKPARFSLGGDLFMLQTVLKPTDFARHRPLASLAAGVACAWFVAGCSTNAPTTDVRHIATAEAKSRVPVAGAFGGTTEGRAVRGEREIVRVAGRHHDISMDVPVDWIVASFERLQAIDRANRESGEHFLITEIAAVADRDGTDTFISVSLRQPPKFDLDEMAQVSSTELGEANAQLQREFGNGPSSSIAGEQLDVPSWKLRQTKLNGQSLRCLEMTILHRIDGARASAELWKTRQLFIPRPGAELRVQFSYRLRDEERLLPVLQAAVASLRY